MMWALLWPKIGKYVIGAGILAALVLAVLGYGHHRYNQGVADTQNAAKLAAYAQYKTDMDRINASNADLQAKLTELQNAKPKVITEYKRVMVRSPLPATCHLDSDRLRGIQSAIAAANAAR